MALTIREMRVDDVRVPTSRSLTGSDVMNPSPDNSVAQVTLVTDDDLEGVGLTFCTGRGNEVIVAAIDALGAKVVGRSLDGIVNDLRGFWRSLTCDGQLRWLGPEKGVIHLATAAITNAVWDLIARVQGKPLWRVLSEMSPEHVVSAVDFSYIADVLSEAEALDILRRQMDGKQARIDELVASGYPSYNTSVGWLGFDDDMVRDLCRAAVQEGWDAFKIKVSTDVGADLRRLEVVRDEIGWKRRLMVDANQAWGVDEAIERMHGLREFNIWWIEEPTNPDDVLGHSKIASAIAPTRVATGEHCQNRVVLKQLLQVGGVHICQVDACRLGGVNEALAAMLLCEKFGVPFCPHAGGIGLAELMQHLSLADYTSFSGLLDDRQLEWVSHSHELFVEPAELAGTRYIAPTAPGASMALTPEATKEFAFPVGPSVERRGLSTWLGLDIGTTSCKALVVSEAGSVMGRARIPYAGVEFAGGDEDEQDPQCWLDAAGQAVETACGSEAGRVAGVGVVGQTPTLTFLDEQLRPLGPAITWRDRRAAREASQLAGDLGDLADRIGTALPWTGANPLAKLLWARNHRPEVRASRWVVQPKDFVAAQLTSRVSTDRWSAKGMVDVRTGEKATEALAAAGWDQRVVPSPSEPWGRLGVVDSRSRGAEWGLPSTATVATGWSDACSGMLALGVFDEPRAFVMTGTSDIVGASGGVSDPGEALLSIPATCAPLPVLYGPTSSSGAALEWARRLLNVSHSELLERALEAEPGSLVFHPYLLGERAPLWRDDLRGQLRGIGPEHGPNEIAAAVVDGVGMTARHILHRANVDRGPIHLAPGTLGQHETNFRLRTLGWPLVVHSEPMLSALGAAILGRAATVGGIHDSVGHLGGMTEAVAPAEGDVTRAQARWEQFEAALVTPLV